MRYIIYCRKSTDTEDKQVQSLESQEHELITLAKAQNLEVVEILKESMSAKLEGRPVFKKLLAMITNGKADGIICWKLDRLARNMVEGGRVMDLLGKGVIQEIKTFESTHYPNDNVLMLAVHFGMANQYSRDLSTNVKRGNRAKLEKGDWPNQAPFGYLNNRATKTIVVDKKMAKYVLRTAELYATGTNTIKQIVDILYQEGLRTRGGGKAQKNHVHRILTKRFYCGLMERDGKIYQGNHKPIISTTLFNQVQDVLHGRAHPKSQKRSYSARGFMRCGSCDCTLTADTQKGYVYYYCTNGKSKCEEHKKYMRSEHVDVLFSELFLKLQFEADFIELSAEAYLAENQDKISYTKSALDSLSLELTALLQKELALADALSSKIMREEVYTLKMKELDIKRAEIKQQIKNIEGKGGVSVVTFERIKNVFIDGNKASNQYLAVGDDKKRNMLGNLLSNATIKEKNIVSYQFKTVFQVLANAPKNCDLNTMLGD